jgi:GLPGLI family protein
MKKFLSVAFIILCYSSFSLTAQTKAGDPPPISFKGKITFERKNNVHKQMEEMMKNQPNSGMLDQVKKQIPKYKIDIFELFFNNEQSLYKLAKDGLSESKMMMGNIPADRNIIFKDFSTSKGVSEKFVFEKTYLIQDSLRQFNWKITEEFRKIAGYNCRRAETVIMDSIYVVAFYTDAIVTPSGPESFSGLPGMILGIVMPRLNTTYFATKVEQYLPNEKDMTPPAKGEKVKYAALDSKLRDSMKQWGEYLQRILWYINI